MVEPAERPKKDPEKPDPVAAEADRSGDLEDTGAVVDGEVVGEEGPIPNRRVQYTTARFSGPLPHPSVLREYDGVVPGLSREIVDQWKGETAHRHKTIDGLRKTDNEAMQSFYKAELRGQFISGVIFLGVLALAYFAIREHEPAVGVAALITAGGSAVWAMRRRSDGPTGPPTDLGSGDDLEDQ